MRTYLLIMMPLAMMPLADDPVFNLYIRANRVPMFNYMFLKYNLMNPVGQIIPGFTAKHAAFPIETGGLPSATAD